jgi:hypothetical protein
VEKGVKQMVALFEEMAFDSTLFKRRGFYRLQQLEYLLEAGYIADDLTWIKNQPD